LTEIIVNHMTDGPTGHVNLTFIDSLCVLALGADAAN